MREHFTFVLLIFLLFPLESIACGSDCSSNSKGICIRIETANSSHAGSNDDLNFWIPSQHDWYNLDNSNCDDFEEGNVDWFHISDYTYNASMSLSLKLTESDGSTPGNDGIRITEITLYSEGKKIDHCTDFSHYCPWSGANKKSAFWLDSDSQGNCDRVTILPEFLDTSNGSCAVVE